MGRRIYFCDQCGIEVEEQSPGVDPRAETTIGRLCTTCLHIHTAGAEEAAHLEKEVDSGDEQP